MIQIQKKSPRVFAATNRITVLTNSPTRAPQYITKYKPSVTDFWRFKYFDGYNTVGRPKDYSIDGNRYTEIQTNLDFFHSPSAPQTPIKTIAFATCLDIDYHEKFTADEEHPVDLLVILSSNINFGEMKSSAQPFILNDTVYWNEAMRYPFDKEPNNYRSKNLAGFFVFDREEKSGKWRDNLVGQIHNQFYLYNAAALRDDYKVPVHTADPFVIEIRESELPGSEQ